MAAGWRGATRVGRSRALGLSERKFGGL